MDHIRRFNSELTHCIRGIEKVCPILRQQVDRVFRLKASWDVIGAWLEMAVHGEDLDRGSKQKDEQHKQHSDKSTSGIGL